MCESSAWLKTSEDDEELLLEDVVRIQPDGKRFILTNIFGEKKELEAVLDHIDLLHHRIILRPLG
jgi:predicted RNA-binding protein